MNRREAKRIAADMVSALITGTLEGGWESIENHAPCESDDYFRIVDALNEIADEMEQRGIGRGGQP